MSLSFEFLNPQDKPALLGLLSDEYASFCKQTLEETGYKVHSAANHGDFIDRFTQVQYKVVLLDEMFDATNPSENLTLQNLETMVMSQRRHAVIILIGSSFKTLDSLQAFQRSAHAVLNLADIGSLGPIIQRVVSENELFLQALNEVQVQVAQSKL
jgi:CheY-like chemotaxis protein